MARVGIDVNRSNLLSGPRTSGSRENEKQRVKFNQRNSLLKILLHGIAFHDPVGVEASGPSEDFEIVKWHAVRGVKGGTDVRALIEWTAAAIEDDLAIALQVGERFTQVRQALGF